MAGHARGTDGAGRLMGVYGAETRPRDIAGYVAHCRRLHIAAARWMALAAARHEASAVLAAMPAPLLVIAGGRDVFAPARDVGHALDRKSTR